MSIIDVVDSTQHEDAVEAIVGERQAGGVTLHQAIPVGIVLRSRDLEHGHGDVDTHSPADAIAQQVEGFAPVATDLGNRVQARRINDVRQSTIQKGQVLFRAYVELGTETGACQLLGLSRSAWHKWTARYERFREAADEAFQTVGDLLEQEAIRRAYDGSDLLLIYLLNGYKPEKFRERQETNINVNSDAIRKFFERAASQPLGPPALTHDISGLVVEAD